MHLISQLSPTQRHHCGFSHLPIHQIVLIHSQTHTRFHIKTVGFTPLLPLRVILIFLLCRTVQQYSLYFLNFLILSIYFIFPFFLSFFFLTWIFGQEGPRAELLTSLTYREEAGVIEINAAFSLYITCHLGKVLRCLFGKAEMRISQRCLVFS